ncbi:copper chaperone PCu(A)C [Epibacterium ulvae]|uniref:copper chaperone PCu(A)C n=1 Tax=Epibacterium ulvae TaxID=1156985 RepID=UPI001BFC4D7C|nr:copper chaperone PCu(A)C [Epibacterium ulvae]MBT8152618.1 copper chaperone PCu(A)C [Epibacterium ulvae]
MSLKSYVLAAGLMAAAVAGWAESHTPIMVEGAYARVSSPTAKTGAIFLEIENRADVADRLIDVKSDVATRVELHTHKEGENGIMQMLHVSEGIVIPADGHHELKRGGDHVMLMGLHHGLRDGDTVPLTLVFEQAGEVKIKVSVDLDRKPGADAHGGHDDHDHSGHDHGN